ncbi:hypothetical protein ACHAWX_004400 [Stephanocyclus meneghinianus]
MESNGPREQSSTPSPPVWFLLFDAATGQQYEGTNSESVSLPPGSAIAEFRASARLRHSNKLARIAPSQLLVYRNQAAFQNRNAEDGNDRPLDPAQSIGALGSENDMLVVVVPSSIGRSRGKRREQRWSELNDIIDRHALQFKTNDSTAYSDLTWNQVKSVFEFETYVQPKRDIEDAPIDFLTTYLSFATKSFSPITIGHEAKRLHFIAPIIFCIGNLFEGDIDVAVDEDVVGDFVHARGHFEFLLRRGNKAVCVVQAKKEDFERGLAQVLVGCEVVADAEGLEEVYGIVTNYVQWNFLRSSKWNVEMEECSVFLTPEGPGKDSIRCIAEKIYSMLSYE